MNVDKVNLMLKERRQKLKKVQQYRDKRIRNKFKKQNMRQQLNGNNQSIKQKKLDNADNDDGDNNDNVPQQIKQRRVQFYNNVFKQAEGQDDKIQVRGRVSLQMKKKNREQKQDRQKNRKEQSDMREEKVQKLKWKKKKMIRKMNQKTNRGQPVMKNYIQYALTKLEHDMARQKLDKSKQKHGMEAESKIGSANKDSRQQQYNHNSHKSGENTHRKSNSNSGYKSGNNSGNSGYQNAYKNGYKVDQHKFKQVKQYPKYPQ